MQSTGRVVFDDIALEEMLRIKERGAAGEVIIATMGPADCQRQLRAGVAMGADRELRVQSDVPIDPLTAAWVLLNLLERERPFPVLLGKQAIGDDNGQTGQMLAALRERPQVTFASELAIEGDGAQVTREVDAGFETLEINLPAVVTVDSRLNEPRYVKLPDIMKAKNKPLETLELAALGVEATVRLKPLRFEPPAQRQKSVRVSTATELVSALKQKGPAVNDFPNPRPRRGH